MNSTSMTKRDVAEILKFLHDVYPYFEVTQSKIDSWTKMLNNQNPAIVMRHAERYALNNKFPPTIADLREVKSSARDKSFVDKVKEWERNATGNKH